MDYFDKTVHQYWVLSDALENAKSSLNLSDDAALTYIRNKLNNYDNRTAKYWRENWIRITKQLNKKSCQSTPAMNVNNYINAQSSTNTINASLISDVGGSISNSSSKRKQPSDHQAQKSNKKQFQLDDPLNDIEAEAAEYASETADEEPADKMVDLLTDEDDASDAGQLDLTSLLEDEEHPLNKEETAGVQASQSVTFAPTLSFTDEPEADSATNASTVHIDDPFTEEEKETVASLR
ncbi:hypothetical protein MUCCIDRAFT_107588 [Mucor lusitanicus CBS 277.49]|uniref:Uncharacterized protein n=1 Tax=Mucor lusitanicus CBS 277.49 TaxID=747725 RepID=A0A162QZV4_MUCCL|nr:hypothetical protein MUCCIDRAFT_107588 [Mucor lusitanicus CBS 277.49]